MKYLKRCFSLLLGFASFITTWLANDRVGPQALIIRLLLHLRHCGKLEADFVSEVSSHYSRFKDLVNSRTGEKKECIYNAPAPFQSFSLADTGVSPQLGRRLPTYRVFALRALNEKTKPASCCTFMTSWVGIRNSPEWEEAEQAEREKFLFIERKEIRAGNRWR